MKLSFDLIKLENEYIVRCPELDINCFGPTKKKAINRIRNVLQFYIDSAQELGMEVENFDFISVDGEQFPAFPDEPNSPKTNSIN